MVRTHACLDSVRLFRSKGIIALMALGLAFLFGAMPVAYGQTTNRVVNGSFEADPLPPTWPFYTGTFSGWTAFGGTLRNDATGPFYVPAANGAIPNGTQVAGIQGGGGSLSQPINGLYNGLSCTPSFYVCRRNSGVAPDGNISVTVTLGSQTIYGPAVISALPFALVNIPTFTYNSAWGNTLTFTTSNAVNDATLLLDNIVFTTPTTYTISGNAGIAGATVTPAPAANTAGAVTADGSGNYSITVNHGWAGSITPTRTGYTFSPGNRVYGAITANQAAQNYTATLNTYTISGNAGISGVAVTPSPAAGTGGAVTTDGLGNYSITVNYGWAGTVTPTRTGYTFSPASRTYPAVSSNQTTQNYTATINTYTISGNAGIAGATVTPAPAGGTGGAVTADGSGNYSLTVNHGWAGNVTPTRAGYTFSPVFRSHPAVTGNQTAQNFTATLNTYTISGNAGVAGATLTPSPAAGTGGAVTADGSGNYSLTVNYGWAGTVTPTLTSYTFTPASRTYTAVAANSAAQNYAAALITYPISVSAVPAAGGSVGGGGSYGVTTTATVTASANAGYTFVNWTEGGTPVSTDASYAFTVAGARTLVANFNADPVISFNGTNPTDATCGTAYSDAGATAEDAESGTLTASIVTTGLPVDTDAVATQTVTYTVTDPVTGTIVTADRTVNVYDMDVPTLNGLPAIVYRVPGATYSLADAMAGVTASDTCAGDLTASIVLTPYLGAAVVPWPITLSAGQSYTLKYSVFDGNTGTTETNVPLVANALPVITVDGDNPDSAECNSAYTDPGATATDDVAGNITFLMVTTGLPVDTSSPGAKTVTYEVTDPVTSEVVTETRTVNVVDSTAPVLSLTGGGAISWQRGTAWTDPGYTATDACEGDLTAAVVVTGTVDTNTVGTYQLDYDVTDGMNAATTVTRQVTVGDLVQWTVQPVGGDLYQTAPTSAPLTLTAEFVNGLNPTTCQWFGKVGAASVPIGTAAPIPVGNVITATVAYNALPAGTYEVYVVVNDDTGANASDTAVVRFGAHMSLTAGLTDLSVNPGDNQDWGITVGGGIGQLSYQWYRDGAKAFVPLTDGSGITGSGTNTLHFTAFDASMAGTYQVEVSDTNESLTVGPATVSVGSSVPVGGALGLAAFAAMTALVGAVSMRRQKK